MISKEKLEEIRSRADIVAIISEYVPLKKRGRNFLGLCPFHSEKTASFTVSPEKQLFHCFGCGEGGNVFAFLMKIEDVGFAQAAYEVAEKVGIIVDKPQAGGTTKSDKDKLYDVLKLANKFFVDNLSGPAKDYLQARGINDETAAKFSLGFAPEAWDGLFKHLISRGAAPPAIEAAGLILPREGKDGFYDRFRNRLMFPVFDLRGRVIAFSGRALDGKEPKYLNSPDTAIYRKGDNIFGLFTTKEEMKTVKTAVLVEGNLDLLSSYQAGVHNVAAPLGTALTTNQCKLLSRFSDTIVLAFDADSAGQAATIRSAELLRSQGLRVKVATWNEAKDPDELIKRSGVETFKQAINGALPFLEFMIRNILAGQNLAEIEGRAKALKNISSLLGREEDLFTQKEYAKLAAGLLGVDSETILAETGRQSFYQQGGGKDLRRTTSKPASGLLEAEKKLIALSAQNMAALETVKKELEPASFSTKAARQIAKVLFNADPAEDLAHFVVANLQDEEPKKFLTQVLLSEDLENPDQILMDCIAVIKAQGGKARIAQLKSALVEAEKQGNAEKAAEILSSLKGEIS
ncbi:MAG: DNA primase [bacterium]